MIEVLRAAPYASIQDLGRRGFRAQGMPLAGAMDPETLSLTNALVGNPVNAAAIEWALGPASLRFTEDTVIAVGAPGVEMDLGGHPLPSWTAVEASEGVELNLGAPSPSPVPGHAPRFGYLAVAGGLDVPLVFGSRSTYLRGGFGGVEGRLVRGGDRLRLVPRGGGGSPHKQRLGEPLPAALEPRLTLAVRVLDGPQATFFDAHAWRPLEEGAYTVSRLSDRMGYRLEGPTLTHSGQASLLSEAVCPGAIQVPDGGAPMVLMPDGPTVGGYPKMAVVISADLRYLAQMSPGAKPVFTRVDLAGARGAAQVVEMRLQEAREWIGGGGVP